MERQIAALESLESRQLMSVSIKASTLTGSLKTGTTWVYENPAAPTVLTTIIAHGGVKLGRVKTIRLDAVSQSGHNRINGSSYVTFNSNGYSLVRSATANNVNTNTSVETFSPPEVQFPTAFKPKVTYRYHWTGTTVDTVSGHKSTSTETATYSVRLASATTSRIHVSAGTFSCYMIEATTVTTSSGSTDTENVVLYVSPKVGLVKEITVDGGNQSMLELKSFKAG